MNTRIIIAALVVACAIAAAAAAMHWWPGRDPLSRLEGRWKYVRVVPDGRAPASLVGAGQGEGSSSLTGMQSVEVGKDGIRLVASAGSGDAAMVKRMDLTVKTDSTIGFSVGGNGGYAGEYSLSVSLSDSRLAVLSFWGRNGAGAGGTGVPLSSMVLERQ